MIRCSVKSENGKTEIHLKGHAGYAMKGYDIVCAGVSALYQTLILSLSDVTETQVSNENDEHIIAARNTYESDLLIRSFLIGYESIAEEYPDYASIDK